MGTVPACGRTYCFSRSASSLFPYIAFMALLMVGNVAASAQQRKKSLPNAPAPISVGLSQAPGGVQTPLRAGAFTAEANNPATALPQAPADSLSLYTVVDLALRNSKSVGVAEAQVQHAHGSMLEMRDAYIPNFSIGSGLGYSYGFPLGNPTLYNVTSTSLLFSFSQRDYIRSTSAAVRAATLVLKNVRQQVILDASLTYIELNKTIGQTDALNQAVADTDNMLTILNQRLNAGLESNLAVTQAKLTRARIHLREIQMEDHADELRAHLSDLTGLPANAIMPSTASIPQLPDLDFKALEKNGDQAPLVQASFATAESKRFAALGDKNQNYRPTVGMAFQYARFAPFNGYSLYYKHFTYNNIGLGIQAVWPLFDPIRRDKAMESKAEAMRARRQAELTKIQTNQDNYALWHSLRELKAEEQVAKLEQQVAKENLASTLTQMNQGSTSSNGGPITPQEADEDRMEERNRYVDLQDAQFNVEQVELKLLNAIGGLEDWARQGAESGAGSHLLAPQVLRHPKP